MGVQGIPNRARSIRKSLGDHQDFKRRSRQSVEMNTTTELARPPVPPCSATWRSRQKALWTSFVSALLFAAAAPNAETVTTGLHFPEGTVFAGNTLYLVDYSTSDVLRLDKDRVNVVWHRKGCGPNGLVESPPGLLVACYDSGTLVMITFDGEVQDTLGIDDQGQPFVAPNDLARDAKGGIYFSASGDGLVPGKVFYRNVDRRVVEVASGIRYANGLVVSPDGRKLYLAESKASRLLEFDIASDGTLSKQREFVKLADILSAPTQRTFTPDGLRTDRQGNLFVGLYRGGGFAVISPDGRLIKEVPLPGTHHASLAISPDGKVIFVTSTDDEAGGGYRGGLVKVANPISDLENVACRVTPCGGGM